MSNLIPVSDAARPLTLEQGRTKAIDFYLFLGDGVSTEPVQNTDVGRVKVSPAFDGSAPALDLDTVGFNGNGSGCLWQSLDPPILRCYFGQGDAAALAAGEYLYEVGLVDDSETHPDNAFRCIERGRLIVQASPGGDVGLT